MIPLTDVDESGGYLVLKSVSSVDNFSGNGRSDYLYGIPLSFFIRIFVKYMVKKRYFLFGLWKKA